MKMSKIEKFKPKHEDEIFSQERKRKLFTSMGQSRRPNIQMHSIPASFASLYGLGMTDIWGFSYESYKQYHQRFENMVISQTTSRETSLDVQLEHHQGKRR